MASIFTKIIRGEIPSYKVAENDKFYAFLDISPLQKGHTLVVPKQEIDYFFDIEDDLMKDYICFAKKIAVA
ncbi:MAG: HIT domain-containing protein, partial [Synergistales bacterium]|nr:HIT domain-containing protein [Synergistales bacterium]